MSYRIETYPTRLIDVWSLADGRRVTLRPVLPQDAELEQALVRSLSPASRYQRFFAPIRELPADWLQRMTQVDYHRHQALIVESFSGEQAIAVAEARFVVDESGQQGEFAVVVADDWQRLGLARRLLESLMRSAAEEGLQRLVGDVLATNRAMLALARGLGFRALPHPDGGAQIVRVQRDLQALRGIVLEPVPGRALPAARVDALPAAAVAALRAAPVTAAPAAME
jgi:acetyltransferase